VTDRKRVEAEIRQLNTELEQRVAERTVELQESNNRLQQYANDIADLYNNAPCGYHSLDTEGTIIQINNTELNWLGYNREELLNLKKFSELLTPESLRVFQENFPKFKQRGYVSDLEFEIIRKNGSTLHISLNGIAIRDAAGNYLMSRSSLFDVSERKRAETERRQIEAALRHSEEQFRHAFEDASIGMAIVSLDGHWIKVNSALCQIIGYSKAKLLTLTFQDITHPNDLATDLNYVRQLLAGEISTYQMEKRYFHQQGQVVWILLNVSLIRNEQGKPLHFISQIQDISDRKRAEASLRRYERIVAATTDAICLLDRNYTHQIVNQAYLDWHGLPLEQIMGHSPRAFLDSELFETRVLPDFERCLAGETIQTQLWIDYLTTGRKFVSTTLSPYYETDQTVSGIVVSLRNLTDLKRAEEALRFSEEQLQLALEASGEGLWDWKIDTGEVYRSSRYLESLGYDLEELPENVRAWEQSIHPDDQAGVFDLLNAHFQDSSIQFACDYRMQTKSGAWKWIADYGKVVARDAQGNPLRMIGTHKDISDRKRTQLELQQAKEAAEIANQSSLSISLCQ
jgi:PAS domain S-box-containing protein